MKLAIFDRHTAILPLSSDTDASQTSVIVRRSALLDALIMFFELMWQRATPIGDGVRLEPGDRADDLSVIVAMLAAGLTDQAIMRQLDISTRTMRRRMASVYQRLNAGTRFQAGYNAALVAAASDSGTPP
ncbi:LuxR C-terminal-related transcriptional regulator [Actinoallomurus sp. NBC_01490]|uniref:LuxR C-terminal-related transcriptional regulator n=1 Tax=Actinoallomurus sp. NBC_01490 TaxID=2903557 RepID=UPI002E37844A|nr:LuxR C-terminal-related transcriptional regulator [Actinoallomurus sp. NBC_01490]